jgi:general secretion pathway protein I
MSNTGRADDRSTAGFTLVEILVAFAVAVLLLGMLYRVFSTGLQSGSVAEDYSRAVLIAESGLEALGALEALAPGESNDQVENRFERHVRVRLRPDLAPAEDYPDLVLYEVEVTVTWRAGRHPRSVSLSTVRLAPPH